MNLYNIYDRALELTESQESGKGLWWSGCAMGSGTSALPADVANAVDKRLIAKLPGVNAETAVAAADARLLRTCRHWNPSLGESDVSKAMDAALGKINEEIATEFTRGGKGVPSRGR